MFKRFTFILPEEQEKVDRQLVDLCRNEKTTREQMEHVILNLKADVNTKIGNISSCLEIACWRSKSLVIVQCLVENGADLESVDDKGYTPFNTACCKKSEIVLYLMEKGVNLNTEAITGFTPLLTAINNDMPIDTIKQMVLKGAKITYGKISIIEKSLKYKQSSDLILFLCEHGLKINDNDFKLFGNKIKDLFKKYGDEYITIDAYMKKIKNLYGCEQIWYIEKDINTLRNDKMDFSNFENIYVSTLSHANAIDLETEFYNSSFNHIAYIEKFITPMKEKYDYKISYTLDTVMISYFLRVCE